VSFFCTDLLQMSQGQALRQRLWSMALPQAVLEVMFISSLEGSGVRDGACRIRLDKSTPCFAHFCGSTIRCIFDLHVQRDAIVGDGRLCPGTWQSFFSHTFGAPLERNVWVQVTGLWLAADKGPFAATHPAFPKQLYARYQTICAPTV
jgi:hypothetical protein